MWWHSTLNPRCSILRIAFILTLALLAAFATADIAVVVGVQKYQLAAVKELKGCESDAKSMGQALKGLGFDVKYVIGKDATRGNVLKTLGDVAKNIKPKENFVFFFAGHGCHNPVGILPYDAQALGNFITPTDLRTAILAIKGATRTVILDSCFSGAMARARGVEMKLRARIYEPRSGVVIEDDEPAAGLETSNPFATDGQISYFTASQYNEPALEVDDPSGSHGVFTECLLPYLKKPLQPWGAVDTDVRKRMCEILDKTGDQQFPTLAPPTIAPNRMFSNERVTVAPPKNLLDLYAQDHVSEKDFGLTALPAKTTFQAGEKLNLDFRFGQSGYLVLLGNLGGKYYVAFPQQSFEAADAQVGTSFHLPHEGGDLSFDDFGEDHIQCLFFTDRERCQAVLDAMRELTNGVPLSEFETAKLDSTKGGGDVFTRRMSFSIGNKLIGGKEAKDLKSLLQQVTADSDAKAKWLAGAIKSQYLEGDPSTEHAQSRFLMLVNLAIQDPVSIYDATAGIQLRPETQALLATNPSGPDLVKLNRWVVEDAYPDHFERMEKGGKRQ